MLLSRFLSATTFISWTVEIITFNGVLSSCDKLTKNAFLNFSSFISLLYRFLFSNFLGKMCLSDHAMSAKEEFILMEDEFEQLKKKARIETKVYDELKLSLLNYEK